MATSKQLNVRLPSHTHKQLDRLVAKLGMTKTQVLILAIDRLDSEEERHNE